MAELKNIRHECPFYNSFLDLGQLSDNQICTNSNTKFDQIYALFIRFVQMLMINFINFSLVKIDLQNT